MSADFLHYSSTWLCPFTWAGRMGEALSCNLLYLLSHTNLSASIPALPQFKVSPFSAHVKFLIHLQWKANRSDLCLCYSGNTRNVYEHPSNDEKCWIGSQKTLNYAKMRTRITQKRIWSLFFSITKRTCCDFRKLFSSMRHFCYQSQAENIYNFCDFLDLLLTIKTCKTSINLFNRKTLSIIREFLLKYTSSRKAILLD